MKSSTRFGSIKKLADRFANNPSQGKPVLVSYLLQTLELVWGQGNCCANCLHFASICITMHHILDVLGEKGDPVGLSVSTEGI